MNIAQKNERYCRECVLSRFKEGPCILASGLICYKNPFKPVAMGFEGKCSDRNNPDDFNDQFKKKED